MKPITLSFVRVTFHIWNQLQKVQKMKSVVEYSPVMQNNNDPLLKDHLTKRVSCKKYTVKVSAHKAVTNL